MASKKVNTRKLAERICSGPGSEGFELLSPPPPRGSGRQSETLAVNGVPVRVRGWMISDRPTYSVSIGAMSGRGPDGVEVFVYAEAGGVLTGWRELPADSPLQCIRASLVEYLTGEAAPVLAEMERRMKEQIQNKFRQAEVLGQIANGLYRAVPDSAFVNHGLITGERRVRVVGPNLERRGFFSVDEEGLRVSIEMNVDADTAIAIAKVVGSQTQRRG